MKRSLTLALALVAIGAFTGLGVAQQKGGDKGSDLKQPASGERVKAGGRVCSNCYVCKCNTGSAGCLCDSKVTHLDNKAKTVSVRRKDGEIIILDASQLTTLPNVGQTVHVQYIDVGGRPTAQSVATAFLMKVKVLEINSSAKTLTVRVNGEPVAFNAANLETLPKAGEMINMGGDDPTGQRLVCAVVECDMGWGSGYCIKCFDYQPLRMTGKVIRDNQSGKTFTVMAKGKEVTFSSAKLKVPPKVGEIIEITYVQNPGGSMEAVNLNSSKSNIY